VRRNYHLDWDGFSHCSAIEQNFNPLVEDINRRQKLGLEVFFFGRGEEGKMIIFYFQDILDCYRGICV